MTQEELANNLGKSQSAVANKIRLLNLDESVQDALLKEQISERHARSLLNVPDKAKQKELLNKVIMNRMTVKQLDDEIALLTGNKSSSDAEGGQNVLKDDSIFTLPNLDNLNNKEEKPTNNDNNIKIKLVMKLFQIAKKNYQNLIYLILNLKLALQIKLKNKKLNLLMIVL